MIVSIRSSRAFAGVERHYGSVDTGDLPEFAANTLCAYVAALASWNRAHVDATGGNFLNYEFEITDDGNLLPRRLIIRDNGDPSKPPMSVVSQILALFRLQQPAKRA